MLSRSSAVLLCVVKRGFGVEVPGVEVREGGLDAMVYEKEGVWLCRGGGYGILKGEEGKI